jgi:NADH-quinone oxidoreductase subunit M
VAEFQIFAGTFAVHPGLAGLGLLGTLITAALFLQMLQRMFMGDLRARWSDWRELRRVELVALAGLLFFVVWIGVAPAWLLDVIDSAVRGMVDPGVPQAGH